MSTDASISDLHVLVFTPFGKDSVLIERVLTSSGIRVDVCGGPDSLVSAIGEEAGAAIITEEVLQSAGIGSIVDKLSAQPRWSDFPIIVLTGGGMSTASTESAERSRAPLGNVSLLERPLRPATLVSAVRTALTARLRQLEIRDHLREREAAEQALRRAHDVLETQVEQRTAALRLLSSRLMRVQDEERRRIARELHDSLGQYLAAAKINLDVLAAEKPNAAPHLREASNLIERAISDTRTLSHLLHPPLLDEAGFGTAAKWFVEGFGSRSKITTRLEMPPNLDRLPSEIEIALFRILQESLTNVHRHSGTKKVEVRLRRDDANVSLEIEDHGKGIAKELLEHLGKSGANVGVGLAGMRERVAELGGTFDIRSGKKGTCLTATIPVPQRVADDTSSSYSARAASNHPVA
ncbi:MAG TPA: sensor histidine kinase [Candidatus Acidoferrum sp.]|nr:sensor histidine kinase [Candidatus Acidoferrum sp.]